MKKITLITLSLIALLATANMAYSIERCELEVTKDQPYDPCVVINRAGVKKDDVWVPVGQLGDDSEQVTLDECKDAYEEGDGDEVYFDCHQERQERAAECTLDKLTDFVSEDEGYCYIGERSGGYETAVIMFQMEHVSTPGLHKNYTTPSLVETNDKHIETVIKEPLHISPISYETKRQFIFSDARAFWEGFDGLCLGSTHCKRNSKHDYWADGLAGDSIPAFRGFPYEVPFFDPDNYYDHRRVTILEARDPFGVPMIVEGLNSDKFVFNLRGPLDHENAPRYVFRGLDVDLKSGRGFASTVTAIDQLVHTQPHSELVFDRSRIKVGDLNNDATVFHLSANTKLDFCGGRPPADGETKTGLSVYLGNVFIPVFTFDGTPHFDTYYDISRCLEISFDSENSEGEELIPMRTMAQNDQELVETCTVVKEEPDCDNDDCLKCDDEEAFPSHDQHGGVLYLVFRPQCTGTACTFSIEFWPRPVHLADSSDSLPPIVYMMWLSSTTGNDNLKPIGTRIEFDLSQLEKAEDDSSDSSDRLDYRPWGNFQIYPSAPATIRPDWRTDNDDTDENQDDSGCADGFIEVDGECVEESDGGSNTNPDLSDDVDSGLGDPDPVVCVEGQVLIWGTCISESEHEDLNSGNTIEETPSDAGGGCSLMASQSTGSWARFLLIVPALLGLWLCRSLRRRRCTNCKPARGSTQDRPSPHVCKCSTKCC